jgi:hypothetical protein
MAPEVAHYEHYSFSCDVHAFAILLWEICALGRPYAIIRFMQTKFKIAVQGNIRPPVGKVVATGLKIESYYLSLIV